MMITMIHPELKAHNTPLTGGIGASNQSQQRQGLLATPSAAKELLEVLPQFTAKTNRLLSTSESALVKEVGQHWVLNSDTFGHTPKVARMEDLIHPTSLAGKDATSIVGKAAKTVDSFIQGLQKQDDSVTLTGVKHIQRIKPGGKTDGDTLHIKGKLSNGLNVERRLPLKDAQALGPNMFLGLPEGLNPRS
jgi:hypothetical protein